MHKLLGFALITAVTSYSGNYFSVMLKNRLIILRKINYMIDEIIMMLRFKSPTVYEITDFLKSCGRFPEFVFLDSISADNGTSFQQCWCGAVEKTPPQGLNKNDIELLEDIGRKLGTSDTESQINSLGLRQSELLSAITAAEADYNKKAKLYRSMGILSGAFISVMLI